MTEKLIFLLDNIVFTFTTTMTRNRNRVSSEDKDKRISIYYIHLPII
jgi:hypothetical protein